MTCKAVRRALCGVALRELRELHGLSMSMASEALGVPRSTYTSYEYGRCEPNLTLLSKIADLYHVTTDYLLGREPKANPLSLMDLQVDINEDKVIEQYMQLQKEIRKTLLEVMVQLGNAADYKKSQLFSNRRRNTVRWSGDWDCRSK